MDGNEYVSGFIERVSGGSYQGRLNIEGINISPIIGVYFKKDNEKYLYLKRKNILEYDEKTGTYKERSPTPKWEAYLKKRADNNTVAYKGEFYFMHFRFNIIGVWDKILGTDNKRRLNLIVEKMARSEQTLINKINERKIIEQNDRHRY